MRAVAPKPVNVLVGGEPASVVELSSYGRSSRQRRRGAGAGSMGGLLQAATELADLGTFASLARACRWGHQPGFHPSNLTSRPPTTCLDAVPDISGILILIGWGEFGSTAKLPPAWTLVRHEGVVRRGDDLMFRYTESARQLPEPMGRTPCVHCGHSSNHSDPQESQNRTGDHSQNPALRRDRTRWEKSKGSGGEWAHRGAVVVRAAGW